MKITLQKYGEDWKTFNCMEIFPSLYSNIQNDNMNFEKEYKSLAKIWQKFAKDTALIKGKFIWSKI